MAFCGQFLQAFLPAGNEPEFIEIFFVGKFSEFAAQAAGSTGNDSNMRLFTRLCG